MKSLSAIFGVAIVMIIYGFFKDFSIADYAAWSIVISALAIGGGWLLSVIIPAKKEAGDDERS